jgi:hypothetical protein
LRNRATVVLTGGLAGALIGIVLFVLFVGRFAMGTLAMTDNGDALLSVTGGALYLGTVIVALIGGLVVSAIAYGASSEADDTATRFELAHILPFGLVAAVAAGYSILRAGVGLAGDAAAGVVSIRVAPLVMAILLAGLVAGMVVSWVVSTLAAKRIVGLEGEAAPASTAAMMRAATQAVSRPMLAIVVIAALAIGLSQLLLAAQGNAAIAIFGGAAAVVLLGAAAAAYMGGGSENGNKSAG